MRCKKHLSDLSSGVGVCASCLRENLVKLIAAQAQQSHTQSQVQNHLYHHNHLQNQENQPHHNPTAAVNDNCLKFDQNPQPVAHPIIFPRSVSPYISRRKSNSKPDSVVVDDSSNHCHPRHQVSVRHHPRFFSTPQAGPTFSATSSETASSTGKKKQGKFKAISKLFKSKSQISGQPSSDPDISSSDPKVFTRQPCHEASPAASSSSSSSSWISNFGFRRRKSSMRLLSVDESSSTTATKTATNRGQNGRGMSPDLTVDESDGWPPCSPQLGQEEWKRTPRSATGANAKRSSHWRPSPGRSNLAFCLSPLVRASPTRHWSWNGKGGGVAGLGTPDVGYSGEIRGGGSAVKPHLSAAASFCANRSRKLADIGRINPNR